jgi:hypothetical protein
MMPNTTKKYIGIRIAGAVILIAIISYVGYKLYDTTYRLMSGIAKMVVTSNVPDEYCNLFKNDANETYQETHFDDNKNLNGVSDLIFEDKYVVYVTKIKSATKLNSIPLITLHFDKTGTSDDIPYSAISRSDYSEIQYFLDTLSATNLSLHLYGDSVRSIIKNDTAEAYYLRNRVSSINYKKDGLVNLFMKTTKSEISLPTVLLFLVRHKTLYFMYISVSNPNDKLDMNVVNKLIDIRTSSVGAKYR